MKVKSKAEFLETLKVKASRKSYTKIQYFSDIHEFITVVAVAKELRQHNGSYCLVLATGEVIPVEKIVRIDDDLAPGHNIMDFTCDC